MDCASLGYFRGLAGSTRRRSGSPVHLCSRLVSRAATGDTYQRQCPSSLPTSVIRDLSTPEIHPPAAMKVYAISDLHTDYKENMDWVDNLSKEDYIMDTLLVAGDVADSLKTFETTIKALKQRFCHVFLVPGNHDLWCRRKEDPPTSLEKLAAINKYCEEAGVETAPKSVGNVWIVPLLSWHHQSFDVEQDIEGYRIPPLSKVSVHSRTKQCSNLNLLAAEKQSWQLSHGDQACMDYRVCSWPSHFSNEDDSLAQYFDNLNDPRMDDLRIPSGSQIISFSHFLPRHELCPEKRMLFYPGLPKIVGSTWLERRVRLLHGAKGNSNACHVFGHTHFAWDQILDGIRYIQPPLGYPKERERLQMGKHGLLPLLLYDSGAGGLVPDITPCHWSEYYKVNPREPANTTLAPWVSKLYRRKEDADTVL